MLQYRSLATIQAVQFHGDPIPGVTCHGSVEETEKNGCDASRKHHPHVHTAAVGGMNVIKPGDWIFPLPGGPFGTASNEKFRAHWEVPPAAGEPVTAVLGETVILHEAPAPEAPADEPPTAEPPE